uniref:prominin-1 isoform X2 n=1 Tax=Myxine glutinosa TaxID=7769 RepID=UPI00358EBB23
MLYRGVDSSAVAMEARCLGSATALLLLFLLAFSAFCEASEDQFPQLPNTTYLTKTKHLEKGLGHLPSMTNAFLDVIQPKDAPYELFSSMFPDYQQDQVNQVLEYEVGFLICAIIGVLFILIMPLVGFCFCICRCCDNCGGKMRQKAESNTPYRRCTFLSLLLFFTVLMVTGAFFSIVANEKLHHSYKEIRDFSLNTFDDMKTYMRSIPKETNFIASQFTPVYNRTKESIDFVDTRLGLQIQNIFRGKVEEVQIAVSSLSLLMSDSRAELVKIDTLQKSLQSDLEKLRESLKNETRALNETLATCSTLECKKNETRLLNETLANCTTLECKNLQKELDMLVPGADFNKAPNVDDSLNVTNDVLKTNLSSLIKKGNDSFNSIPEMVKNQTKDVSDATSKLDDVKSQVEGFSDHLKFLNGTLSHLDLSANITRDALKIQDRYEHYRWIVALVICCIIFFIVLLIILGILFGLCGTSKKATPTSRGCVSHSGGNFLMAAVGFSFLLSWIIMIVVLILFVTGGNIHKLACKPLADGTLFESIDKLDKPEGSGSIFLRLIKPGNYNLSTNDVLRNCENNEGIFTALPLESMYNFDIQKRLNFSKYTKDFDDKLAGMNVEVGDVEILSTSGRKNLEDFNESGINDLNFTAITKEMENGIVKMDLLEFADKMDNINASARADSLRKIHHEQVVPMNDSMKDLKTAIQQIETMSKRIQPEVDQTLHLLDNLDFFIKNGSLPTVKQVVVDYFSNITNDLVQYVTWGKEVVMTRLGSCKPVVTIVNTAEAIFCKTFINATNVYWFGLGWSLFFLIPTIIFAVKLAKFFRRMDAEETYENDYLREIEKSVRPTKVQHKKFNHAENAYSSPL